MELKNMNGFEAMNERELLSVDGGARRVAAAPVSGGSWQTAVGAQATVTGWVLSAAGVGMAFGGPAGALAFACVGFAVSTVGLGSLSV